MSVVPLALALALSLLTHPRSASANDSSFGGEGADLAPLRETRVRMKSEDITLTLRDDLWHVEARYRFHNPTGDAVALQMGFPERHCDPADDCNEGAGRFLDLHTEVRGEPVEMREGRVGSEHAWAPRLGRVFLFDVRFGAGEELQVVHRYRMPRSTFVETRDEVFYVTRTGALWAGPIERARFTVRTPYRPGRLAFPREYLLQSFTERMDGATPMTELVFEQQDWTPTHDLDLHLYDTYAVLGEAEVHCPDPSSLDYYTRRLRERLDERERLRIREQLARTDARFRRLDDAQRRICRNMVFAVHGFAFRSADLRRIFYPPPRQTADPFGYMSAEEAREAEDAPVYTVVLLQENAEYQRSLVRPYENRYLQRLNRR